MMFKQILMALWVYLEWVVLAIAALLLPIGLCLDFSPSLSCVAAFGIVFTMYLFKVHVAIGTSFLTLLLTLSYLAYNLIVDETFRWTVLFLSFHILLGRYTAYGWYSFWGSVLLVNLYNHGPVVIPTWLEGIVIFFIFKIVLESDDQEQQDSLKHGVDQRPVCESLSRSLLNMVINADLDWTPRIGPRIDVLPVVLSIINWIVNLYVYREVRQFILWRLWNDARKPDFLRDFKLEEENRQRSNAKNAQRLADWKRQSQREQEARDQEALRFAREQEEKAARDWELWQRRQMRHERAARYRRKMYPAPPRASIVNPSMPFLVRPSFTVSAPAVVSSVPTADVAPSSESSVSAPVVPSGTPDVAGGPVTQQESVPEKHTETEVSVPSVSSGTSGVAGGSEPRPEPVPEKQPEPEVSAPSVPSGTPDVAGGLEPQPESALEEQPGPMISAPSVPFEVQPTPMDWEPTATSVVKYPVRMDLDELEDRPNLMDYELTDSPNAPTSDPNRMQIDSRPDNRSNEMDINPPAGEESKDPDDMDIDLSEGEDSDDPDRMDIDQPDATERCQRTAMDLDPPAYSGGGLMDVDSRDPEYQWWNNRSEDAMDTVRSAPSGGQWAFRDSGYMSDDEEMPDRPREQPPVYKAPLPPALSRATFDDMPGLPLVGGTLNIKPMEKVEVISHGSFGAGPVGYFFDTQGESRGRTLQPQQQWRERQQSESPPPSGGSSYDEKLIGLLKQGINMQRAEAMLAREYR
ncbi:hypothetical protein F4779DRAFT_632915 [Xylariaceae sp. FL0662B]|nr:hypothetical protein F4779DRAFT_632915 [Xylariaceae sp. FL0662B]